MLLAVLGFAAFVDLIWSMILLVRSRDYRIDLKPGQHFGHGSSPFWQLNVLNPANYDSQGKKLVRSIWIAQIIWAILLVTMLVISSGT